MLWHGLLLSGAPRVEHAILASMKLNEQAAANALFANPERRGKLMDDYNLKEEAGESSEGFLKALVTALDQEPLPDPMVSLDNATVFEAAVKAIGSNSRDWTTFMAHWERLGSTLGDCDVVYAARLEPGDLDQFFPGQNPVRDAKAVITWARYLADYEERGALYYDGVCELGKWMRLQGAERGVSLPDEHLMLCLVAHLAHEPSKSWGGPKLWKLPGMGFPIGSEFFRNVGWNGFKPDRHIERLLTAWVPELVEAQRDLAEQLLTLVGRNTKDLRNSIQLSLAGIALTPDSASYSSTDNLLWLLGANVIAKGAEQDVDPSAYLIER